MLAEAWLFPLDSASDVCPGHTAARCRGSAGFKENTIKSGSTDPVSCFQSVDNGAEEIIFY